MMKKIPVLLTAALLLFTFPAMGEQTPEKLSIVATIFPAYDFAREVTGGLCDISMLLPPGSESHSYEPTPQDIIAIQNADLFVYVGGEGDHWVEEILDSMEDNAPQTLTLMECVEIVEEELVEGMEEEAEEHAAEAEGEVEYDEHVWTSPKNAIKIVEKLASILSELDVKHGTEYRMNAEGCITKLGELDAAFQAVVDQAARKTIIFGDRFPLRYFADAYGLSYYAAFPGCSTETEPSVKTITFLMDKVVSEAIPVVFYIEFSNHKAADAIAEETGAKTLLFHSCHNVSPQDMENGATYLTLMTQNVQALKEALN